MTDPPPASEAPAPAPAPEPTHRHVSRGRSIGARILVILGVLLVTISALSNFVKREALDSGNFRETSRELIANDQIRDQIAAQMVETLYANVDVSGELQDQLPKNLKALSGPIAGISRDLADRGAREVLQRPRVQALFVTASSAAQKQLIAVLEGGGDKLQTTNGDVVLDIRPLVLVLGDRFNIVDNLGSRLPADAGQVTILHSDQLETAQTITDWLKAVADWIWVPAILAWVGALLLVPGRRRREVRAIGIGLIVVGVLLLAVRSLAGNYIVDHVVVTESVKPAVSEAWEIITDSLAASAWAAIWVGIITALAAWITGSGRRAVGVRRWIGPHMRRPEVAYGIFAFLLFVALWWIPIQDWKNDVILAVLAVVGFEVFRRQVARETPAGGGDMLAGVKARVAEMRESVGKQEPSRTDELERLAKLRADGVLTDEEFAAAKADLFS